jgi:hypothetical protein
MIRKMTKVDKTLHLAFLSVAFLAMMTITLSYLGEAQAPNIVDLLAQFSGFFYLLFAIWLLRYVLKRRSQVVNSDGK